MPRPTHQSTGVLTKLLLFVVIVVNSPSFFSSFLFYRCLGVRIGLFTPDKAFDIVCKSQISRIREPALKLVDLVTTEMMSTVKDGTAKVKLVSTSLSILLTGRLSALQSLIL